MRTESAQPRHDPAHAAVVGVGGQYPTREMARAVSGDPGASSGPDAVDLCGCGCGRALSSDDPALFFASEECAWRWYQTCRQLDPPSPHRTFGVPGPGLAAIIEAYTWLVIRPAVGPRGIRITGV